MPRLRWAVRCEAHRSSDGEPCRAWAIRGGFTCVKHGSATRRARELAEYRLWRTKHGRKFIRDFQAMVLRLKAQSPEEGIEAGKAALRKVAAEQGWPEPQPPDPMADLDRRARRQAAARRRAMIEDAPIGALAEGRRR